MSFRIYSLFAGLLITLVALPGVVPHADAQSLSALEVVAFSSVAPPDTASYNAPGNNPTFSTFTLSATTDTQQVSISTGPGYFAFHYVCADKNYTRPEGRRTHFDNITLNPLCRQIAVNTPRSTPPTWIVLTDYEIANGGIMWHTFAGGRNTLSSTWIPIPASLTVTLSPTFAAGTTAYTGKIPSTADSLRVTPTASSGTINVRANSGGNNLVTSGTAHVISLESGDNTVRVEVANGTTRTYTVTLSRDQTPSFSGTVPNKIFHVGSRIDAFQVPSITGGDGTIFLHPPDLPSGLTFDFDGSGGCPGTQPRTICGTPTVQHPNVPNSFRSVLVFSATDSDANTSDSDRAVLFFSIAAIGVGFQVPFDSPLIETTQEWYIRLVLYQTVFESSLSKDDFELVTNISGLSIDRVRRDGDRIASMFLNFTGDFNTPQPLAVKVKDSGHRYSGDLTTPATTVFQTADVTVSESSLNLEEAPGLTSANQDTYSVVLDTQPAGGNVVIGVSSDNTDVTVNPSTLTFTRTNWDTAQVVTVTAGTDADGMDDSATVSHTITTAAVGYPTTLSIPNVSVNVNDAMMLGTPGNVQVTAFMNSLEVSWDQVTDADGYKVQWKTGSQEYNAGATINSGTTTTHKITGLTAGMTYTIRVLATRNNYDDSDPSTEQTGVPLKLSTPGNVQVTAFVDSLEVSWDRVPDADGYKVQWKSSSQEYNTGDRQATVTGGATTTHRIGLTAGMTYTVRVIATETGESDSRPSAEQTGIPKHDPPGVPGNVTVTDQVLALRVAWNAATNADGYKVQWKAAGDAYDAATREYAVGGTDTTITGLTAGTSYTVRVLATREHADDGPASSEPTGTPLAIPTLSITSPDVAEGADGATDTLRFAVTLSHAIPSEVTVDYADARTGSATSGEDYTALATGTLTIAANVLTDTLAVAVIGDGTDEPDETVDITLSNPTNAIFAAGAAILTSTGTITNDDSAMATLFLSSASISEAGGITTVTATLSSAVTAEVTITVSVSPEEHAVRGDFTLSASATLTIAVGQTTSTGLVTITANDNAARAATKSVTVSGTADVAKTVANPDPVTLTITDDESSQVTLVLSPASISENGGVSTVTATLSNPENKATTITVSAMGDDFTLSATDTLTIEANETTSVGLVTITAQDNMLDADAKSVTVSGTVTGGNNATAPRAVTLTITDDDDPPTLSIISPSAPAAEGNTGSATLSFRVTLSAPSEKQITVDYAMGTGTATAGEDYTALTAGTLTFSPRTTSQTLAVFILDDAIDELAETVVVTLRNPTNAALDGGGAALDGTGTITDDDALPALSIDDPSVAEGNSGPATLRFTVSLNAASGQEVKVAYRDARTGTATSGTDYVAITPDTLTFAVGETSKTIDVSVTGDALNELDETVIVALSSPSNATIATGTGTGTITNDDDPPTVSITSPNVTEGNSGSATLRFAVSLSAASGQQVTVDYADAGTGTATSETDYTAITPNTLTFEAGETRDTIDVSVTGDAISEPHETVIIQLSSPSNATIATATGTGTITNDDDAPIMRLYLSTDMIAESGTSNVATVTARLNRPSSAATTVTVSATAGTNAVAGNFMLSDADTLLIAAGDTTSTGTVTITAVDNNRDEPIKLVQVSAMAHNSQGVTNLYETGTNSIPLTITDDDDEPTMTLSLSDTTIAESGSSNVTTVTATLDIASSAITTVTVTAEAGDNAVAGNFRLSSADTLLIAAGATTSTGTVTITAVDNDVDEPSKSVSVSAMANNSRGVTDPDPVILEITDDDDPPTVTLSVAQGSISENGGTTNVTAVLSNPSSAATTITVRPLADAYTVGEDSTIVIAAGSTADASETVAIAAVDNARDEEDRAVTVSGVASNDQGVGAVTGADLTLIDDEDPPELAIDDQNVAEGADGATATLQFPVSLSAASNNVIKVAYRDAGTGTATSGTDYTAVSADTLTFAAGVTSQTIPVSVTGDAMDEPDETVVIELSGPSNATIETGTGTGTITDDDDAPTVTLSVAQASISENGGTTNVTATLSHPSSAATTITVRPVVDAYTVGEDSTIVIAAESTMAASDTVAIAAVNNARDEEDRAVTVLGVASNDQGVGAVTGANLTLIDDDDAPTLSIDDQNVAEGADGATPTLQFTVSLSAASNNVIKVAYRDAGTGTATSGTDYTAVSADTLTFAAGVTSQTIPVSVTGDAMDEPDETVVIELSGPSNATIETGTGTGTITDDDDAPTVTLSVAQASISENGGTTNVTATLSHPSSAATTITVRPVVDAYTVGEDSTIVIAAESTMAASDTVAIAAVNNARDEEDRAVTVLGVASNDQGVGAVTGANLTLIDDDDAPTLSIDDQNVAEGADGATPTLQFTVSLSAASNNVIKVAYRDAGTGTATSGTDYTAVSADTLTFAVGVTSQTIDVSVTGDAMDEPDETVVIELSGPSNATITKATGTGTITDDDDAPTVTLSVAQASISENGGTTNVTATLSHPSSAATTITVRPVVDAYTVGEDSTIVIAAESTMAASDTVAIAAVNNARDEEDRAVTVSGVAINDQGVDAVTGADLTLTDDDNTPMVTLSLSEPTIQEMGSPNVTAVTARLNRPSSAITTVTVEASAGDNAVGSDFTLSGATLVIAADSTMSTGTVTITAVNNEISAPPKKVIVSGTAVNDVGVTNPDAVTLTIDDDEGDPAVTLSLSEPTIQEMGSPNETTVTARLNRASSAITTVTVSAAPKENTGTVAGDFRLSGTTLVIAANATASTGTVTITAVDNDTHSPNKEVNVSGTAANDVGVVQPAVVILTISDDDDAPTVALSVAQAEISENGGTTNVTATLSHPSSAATTITVRPVAGDYTVGADSTIVIAAGSMADASDTVAITAVDNDRDDGDNRVVTVSGVASNDQGVGAVTGATLTLTDDENPPTLSINDPIVPEGADGATLTLQFMVSLSAASNNVIKVAYAEDSAARTATPGTDYTAVPADTLTFAVGVTRDTIDVSVTGDAMDEPDETVVIELSGPSNATITKATGTGTITDDDDAPTVMLAVADRSISENGEMTNVTAALSNPSSAATTITVRPVADAYTVGSDSTIVIAAGFTMAASDTVAITAVDNARDEEDRDVTVLGVASNDQGVGPVTGADLTLTDDDAEPEVTLSLSASMIDENGGISTVTATLNRPSSAITTVTVEADAGDNAMDGDFNLSGATLVIAADSTMSTGTVTITANDNEISAPRKRVRVSGTAVNDVGVTNPDDVTLTIADDESDPTVALSLSDPTIQERGSPNETTVTATLNRPSSAITTVTVEADAGDNAMDGDFTLSSADTLLIAANATASTGTVTITAEDNDTDAPNKKVRVSGTAVNDVGVTDPDAVILTIIDDEVAPTMALSVADTLISENGGSTNVTATLSHPSSAATTVTVLPVTGDYTVGADSTIVIAAGSTVAATDTVAIAAVDNDRDDGDDRDVTVLGVAHNDHGVETVTGAALTLTDDDDAPTLSIDDPSVDEGAAGETATLQFPVSLSAESGQRVTVDYADAGTGTATSGTDYPAITAGTLTFEAGVTRDTIAVSVTGDAENEPDETVIVTLRNVDNATFAGGDTTLMGTGTITNDDQESLTMDVDADGTADLTDAIMVILYIFGLENEGITDYILFSQQATRTDPQAVTAYIETLINTRRVDIDADGTVDLTDIIMVILYIFGLENEGITDYILFSDQATRTDPQAVTAYIASLLP